VLAVVCREFGPIDRLTVESLPDPAPGAGEVVIDVRAAGVNFPDGLMVRGEYQVKPPRPFTPGAEVAGVVSALGAGVTEVAVGDRVLALCIIGGYAEKVVVAADRCQAIPDSMEFDAAAGLMLVYGTAYHALTDKGRLAAGETLLVLGAAGGVGLAAVQIGRAMGARVIAAASSEAKLHLARQNGAELCINYARDDLRADLKRVAPGGVDVVFDPVGGGMTEAAVRGLGWGGRLLVIGFANGEIPRLPLNLLLLKEAAAIGVFFGAFTQNAPKVFAEGVARLLAWCEDGTLRPHIGGRFVLQDAGQALAEVMERRAQGKIVLIA
jgi:NADPH2:quinone reductase